MSQGTLVAYDTMPLAAAYWFSLCASCNAEPEICTCRATGCTTIRCPSCGFQLPLYSDTYKALSEWYLRSSNLKALEARKERSLVSGIVVAR